MAEIKINKKIIGNNHPVYIIAELGINHQGNIDIAKELILQAKDCGADCVKFQKRSINRILTKEGLNMPYLNSNSFGETYGEHKKALELSEEDYSTLFSFAKKNDIDFSASGWDEIASTFRKPIAYTNVVPIGRMITHDKKSLLIAKHHKHIKYNKRLFSTLQNKNN